MVRMNVSVFRKDVRFFSLLPDHTKCATALKKKGNGTKNQIEMDNCHIHHFIY